MTAGIAIFQALVLVLAAPLVRGIVGRMKARFQRRQGASIWRPYSDLIKLFQKEDLVPPAASWIFRAAPRIVFAAMATAAAFVPVFQVSAIAGHRGDFILFVYLLAIGRFFLMLGAIDGGSGFGGMGASREALVSTMAEGPLLLAFVAVSIVAHSPSIAGIVEWTVGQNFFDISAVHILAFTTLGIVSLAEAGRMPVDNPATHLELTMIHEGMVLEYSGASLAFVEWANAIKLNVLLALLIALFAPWGIATQFTWSALVLALGAYGVKLLILAVLLAGIESVVAKLRMYLVPDFLGVATALSTLAVIFTMIAKR
jgi:formate hydrogenlyase subunit 4